ncbi:hypothetical protein LIER_17748 [Lithospermum erythrorhizon]|uniref:Pectinesterase inhibitor domain-containing protein n=1 Tax=Lithospermum erythrorhizon TaxID=34254 RepID=A0AAV3QEA1_LITER
MKTNPNNVFSSNPLNILISILLFCAIDTMMAQNVTLIRNTCKSSSKNNPNVNVNFCITSLQSAPASRCAALRGLEIIAIRLLRYNVTDTRCFIKQLVTTKNWNQFYKNRLNDCYELYSDAIPSVKKAMQSFSGKLYDDANIQISAVMDAATTCEDGFKEGGNEALSSPLKKRNDDMFQLGAIALSFLGILQAGSSN